MKQLIKTYFKQFTTLSFVGILFFSCNLQKQEDKIKEKININDYLSIYPKIILTGKELIKDSIFKVRNYNKYETTKIDTASASILNIEYSLKINDTINNCFLYTSTSLMFRENIEISDLYLRIGRMGFDNGFYNNPKLPKDIHFINIDSLFTFGETSNFIKFEYKNNIVGYYISGKSNNVVFFQTIISDCLKNIDYISILKNKINRLEKFQKTQKHFFEKN